MEFAASTLLYLPVFSHHGKFQNVCLPDIKFVLLQNNVNLVTKQY